jgi:hypothetical protein
MVSSWNELMVEYPELAEAELPEMVLAMEDPFPPDYLRDKADLEAQELTLQWWDLVELQPELAKLEDAVQLGKISGRTRDDQWNTIRSNLRRLVGPSRVCGPPILLTQKAYDIAHDTLRSTHYQT